MEGTWVSWQTRLGGGWDHVVLGTVVPGRMPGAVVPAGCLAWYQLYEPGVPRVQRLDPTSEKC